MKKCLILIFLFVSLKSYSQEFSLLEINAKWNAKNSLKIKRLKGIPIKTAWLEEQPKTIQKRIKSVPVLILIRAFKTIYLVLLSFALISTASPLKWLELGFPPTLAFCSGLLYAEFIVKGILANSLALSNLARKSASILYSISLKYLLTFLF